MADRIITANKKAKYDYYIVDTFEAGIVLCGTEVKSVKSGRVSIKEGYVIIDDNMEAYLKGCHISPYPYATVFPPDPLRDRKLLLHKSEIKRLYGMVREKGFTIIPLKIYVKYGKVKIAIALAKGKKVHDKRETIKRKTEEISIRKAFKGKVRI